MKLFSVFIFIIKDSKNINSKNTSIFEKRLAKLSSKKYALTTCNGTLSIQTAIYANNLFKKNIGCAINMIPSSYYPIKVTGNNIMPLEIDNQTLLISNESVEKACKNKKIDALIYCDFYGNYENINDVRNICSFYQIPLIRDCSHSHHNVKFKEGVTNINETICYSFQSSKGISTFEGGAICTDNEEIFTKSLFYLCQNKFLNKCESNKIKNNKYLEKFDQNGYGIKGRINPLGSCIGLVDLRFIEIQNKLINYLYQLSEIFLEKHSLNTELNNKNYKYFSNGCKNIVLKFNNIDKIYKATKIMRNYGIQFYKRNYNLDLISNISDNTLATKQAKQLFDEIIFINIDSLLSYRGFLNLLFKIISKIK